VSDNSVLLLPRLQATLLLLLQELQEAKLWDLLSTLLEINR
jgi:hypothetical protein